MAVEAVCSCRPHPVDKLVIMACAALVRGDLKAVHLACVAGITLNIVHEYMARMSVGIAEGHGALCSLGIVAFNTFFSAPSAVVPLSK